MQFYWLIGWYGKVTDIMQNWARLKSSCKNIVEKCFKPFTFLIQAWEEEEMGIHIVGQHDLATNLN